MKGTKDLVKSEPTRLLAPIEDMERWFEEMWRSPFSAFRAPFWVGTRTTELEDFSPSVDMYETDHELVVKCDIPGVKKNDIKLDVTHDLLTISGEKSKEEKVEKANYYRYESTYGKFSRSFQLPEGLDIDKAKAHFENGVLEIKIPKSPEAERMSKPISIE
jgi:HSP20 family protein